MASTQAKNGYKTLVGRRMVGIKLDRVKLGSAWDISMCEWLVSGFVGTEKRKSGVNGVDRVESFLGLYMPLVLVCSY